MNKKVVLISPDYFNLSQLIKDEIIKQGYECVWFDDRPSKKTIDKMLIRLSKGFLKRKINRYFEEILEYCEENKPDKIIVIIGQSFTVNEHYKKIKEVLPDTELVFYNWDSIANFKNTKDNFDFFDRAYTFDKDDAEKYNLNFLPLFYTYSDNKLKQDLDYSLVVTVKKGKYADLSNIVNQLKTKFNNGYVFMYLQSKAVYRYYKLFDKTFKKAKKSEFSYEKLPPKEVENIFNRSRIVIDIVMDKQSGLTIRTIESLHLKKKIITNNPNIKKYPFYSEDNILVCKDGDVIDFDTNFFRKEFNDNYSIDESYSLSSFVKKLLGE